MLQIVKLILAILVILWVFRQVRKPSGPLGRRVVRAMNLSHAKMTDWGLQQVIVPKNAVSLDIGCGGGRTAQRLEALAPDGRVVGLDFSPASVAVSRHTNAHAIEAGRVQIVQGSVAALPFADRTFDIITAVETHYYWPDLEGNRAGNPESSPPRRDVRLDRRNLPRRAVAAGLWRRHAAHPRRVPECR
jgi:SAM-dependent methyltransferase